MGKTIPRNSKRAAEVLEKAQGVKVYSLANHFRGELLPEHCLSPLAWKAGKTCSPQEYLSELLQLFSFAKLRDNGDGTYTLSVHSNEWYTFTN